MDYPAETFFRTSINEQKHNDYYTLSLTSENVVGTFLLNEIHATWDDQPKTHHYEPSYQRRYNDQHEAARAYDERREVIVARGFQTERLSAGVSA
jgi:hypothetical protein